MDFKSEGKLTKASIHCRAHGNLLQSEIDVYGEFNCDGQHKIRIIMLGGVSTASTTAQAAILHACSPVHS